ncbi:MAG: NAD-binding protein [Aggregatilineales bacterium]
MPYAQLISRRKRRGSLFKSVRAVWRDTSALWSEFRTPIWLFIIVSVVGGYLYGELYYLARGEVIPLIDRPYLMLQLMILETPEPAPAEWYLVVFWYMLPVIFIFIVGLGAADFMVLFFNREGRQDKWMEALASTYRNHTIVFGAGHVGMRVIRILVSMGVDVIVVDNSPDPGLEDALDEWRIPLIVADGRQSSSLEKAGLLKARSFVACTGDDHTNLEAIMRVRELNPDVRIVARMWDEAFARQVKLFMHVQTVFSSSDLAAPAFAGAALGIEISQSLNVNGVDYSTVRLTVEAKSFMEKRSIGELQEKYDMDIVLLGRNDHSEVQPPREHIVQAGDVLVIFAQHDRILDLASRNHQGSNKR